MIGFNKYAFDKTGTFDGYDDSAVSCYFFRWKAFCNHGMWAISMGARHVSVTVCAVVDDFGNLVMVQP
jgi:hypothetical protein